MIGIGFVYGKSKHMLQLFEPSVRSREHTQELNGICDRNELSDKWYMHPCNCFECLYVILIDAHENILSKPGFE